MTAVRRKREEARPPRSQRAENCVFVREAGNYSLWFGPSDGLPCPAREHIISELGSRAAAEGLAALLNQALDLAEDHAHQPLMRPARIAHAVAKVLGGQIDYESFGS